MNKKRKLLLIFVSLLLIIFASSFLSNFLQNKEQVTIDKEEYERLKKFEEMFSIYDTLQKRYYIEPDYAKMEEGAIRGLLSGLDDPYSLYYNPEEFAKYWADDEGEYAGIGVQIQSKYDENICVITRVFKNSPSEEVGLLKGDILVKAGDIEVNPTTLQSAVDYIRGEIGTKVKITVQRGEEELSFDVERRKIHINLVETKMLEGNIGLIQLYEFAGTAGKEFKEAYENFVKEGMKGLILDLRDNPGGWVNNAQGIADLFIDNDVLCYFEYRDGSREYIRTNPGKTTIPMVVLINGNSASASELLSGAFRDYGLAEIVGTTSFGKGIAQEVVSVGSRGAGFQYTVAQYFTPKGGKVHNEGITPDHIVELTEEQENKKYELGDLSDPQLAKAVEVMQKKLGKE